MIWWPFINEYEFFPEWGKKIQLTEGLSIKYSPFSPGGFAQPKIDFQIWVGTDKHYLISRPGGLNVPATVKITRKKNLVKISLPDGWEQTYLIKTPIIWKYKKLK